jgi:cell division protein FtsA
MAQVLEARILDILDWVSKELKKAENQGLVITSLVLTGGSSQLPGLANLACRELDMPCRIAAPCYPDRLPDQLASPIYSTAVGLTLHGASRRLLPNDAPQGSSKVKVLLGRVGRWLAEVF